MYRILDKKILVLALAWLVIGLVMLSQLAHQVASFELRLSAIPGLAWMILSGILLNPVWRFVWRKVPRLGRWFPDLNGFWDVEVKSNWSRQVQLLDAAIDAKNCIDMRHVSADQLAELSNINLLAEITQTWWGLEMTLTNPGEASPLRRSDTIVIEPISGKGHRPPGICYFYKQSSVSDNVFDDPEFYGAAQLTYDRESDILEGFFSTSRMWRRAMNTAGTVTFTRCK
ncbi:conserved hypothetical protein [Methylorubrum populi BJ001]|uniref:Uncharacterized protein n=1 Tax=Methylorubrum populi (strain ATCC BAA-705 / NCIMB 13946 / BJ001) TaxID=441620 RepID=B1Z8T8_METPB|nr:hypothetical protein [Methylorubrum populi]ACB83240.1 conserved hypothetical protein [Methylorubrum populi BJ001]PZP68192.1 MAG: hypothetical protein DI590_17775 [Methylorubrum populi]